MQGVLWLFLVASILGFFGSIVLDRSYEAKAQKVQIVRIDRSSKNPLGPETIDDGPPILMIAENDQAFMKNKTPLGLPMIDRDSLQKNGSSLIQLDSIQRVTALARIGCLLTFGSMIFGLIMVKRLTSGVLHVEPY